MIASLRLRKLPTLAGDRDVDWQHSDATATDPQTLHFVLELGYAARERGDDGEPARDEQCRSVGRFADPNHRRVRQLARSVASRIAEAADHDAIELGMLRDEPDHLGRGDRVVGRTLDRTRAAGRRQRD